MTTGHWPQPGDTLLDPPRMVVMVDRNARQFQCCLLTVAIAAAPIEDGWTELPVTNDLEPA